MTRLFLFIVISLSLASACAQEQEAPLPPGLARVAPPAGAAFSYPYYLFVPPALRESKATQTMLVLPNNSGVLNDHLFVHEAEVRKRMSRLAANGGNQGSAQAPLYVVALMPVFPRPELDWTIYTHALDRDTMLTEKAAYRRLDLQLLAMIDHARAQLGAAGMVLDARVFMHGFSAAGMFANRFTFLHPQRVKAAAIGSPGGWPMSPLASWEGRALRYPLGSADLQLVAGKPLDLQTLRGVALLLFMGEQDTNDSLPFGDSYDAKDKDLAFALLGTTPVARWPIAERMYRQVGLDARFVLYPGVGHTVTRQMRADIAEFFRARQ